jgi:hypothetical protein
MLHVLGILAVIVLVVAVFASGDVASRLGRVLYWGASGIAVLLLALAAFEFMRGPPDGPFLGILFGGIGIVTWLVGRAVVYVLAGR